MRTARRYHLLEELVELIRVRCGELGWEHLIPRHILHSADEPCAIPRGIQNFFNQEGRGCFAVCSCYANQMKPLRRIVKKRFAHE